MHIDHLGLQIPLHINLFYNPPYKVCRTLKLYSTIVLAEISTAGTSNFPLFLLYNVITNIKVKIHMFY